MARSGDAIQKRCGTWWLDFTHKGERHRIRIGANIKRTAAREIAEQYRAAILRGEAGVGAAKQKPADMTYKAAAEEFLEAKGYVEDNTLRSYRQHIEAMGCIFDGKRLSEITTELLNQYKVSRADTPAAFNRERGTLKTLFRWAAALGKYQGSLPDFQKVSKLKESKGRNRFLELEEEERLLAAAGEPLRTIILCGIYAGLRIPSEVLHLEWKDIDLKRGTLTVLGAFAKNGKTVVLPLSPKLWQALEGLKASAGRKARYVFTRANGKPFKSVQNIFRKAVKAAGLEDVSPHICRHTFASRLVDRGASLRVVQEAGRWSSLSLVERYANTGGSAVAQAIFGLSADSTTLSRKNAAENVIEFPGKAANA